VEIGNDGCRNREAVGREDELVGPVVKRPDLVIGGHECLKTPHNGGAHREHLIAVVLRPVDHLAGLLADDEPLGVHLVLGQILDIDIAEIADAHVQSDESLFDVLQYHPVEQFAAEDKKKKEEVEIRNQADTLVYETEKSIKELEDKLSDDEKAKVNTALEDLKKALEGTDVDAIKAKTEALTNEFHVLSSKLYQQAQGAAGAGAGADGAAQQNKPEDDNVVDADFEVVDDEK